MIDLYWDEGFEPVYQTEGSAGADLRCRLSMIIEPHQVIAAPTGVWIKGADWSKVPSGGRPELQIRARSGLAYKHSIALANGIGTVDLDYRDEIKVLLINLGLKPFEVKAGDRIAQLVLSLSYPLNISHKAQSRKGGFGSTGLGNSSPDDNV